LARSDVPWFFIGTHWTVEDCEWASGDTMPCLVGDPPLVCGFNRESRRRNKPSDDTQKQRATSSSAVVKENLDPELDSRNFSATGTKATKAEAIVRRVTEHPWPSTRKIHGREEERREGNVATALGQHHLKIA
jgi:hypothetical protein